MTDKELLEQAVKAAGIYLEWDGPPNQWQPMYYEGKTYHSWNPLTDDGDALRLAVKLGIGVEHYVENNLIGAWFQPSSDPALSAYELTGNDPYAATRRAIVRAAAEIGKDMK